MDNFENMTIDEMLSEADKKLEESGIDPNGHPDDDEEGTPGELEPVTEIDDNEPPKAEEEEPKEAEKPSGEATDQTGQTVTFKSANDLNEFVKSQMETLKSDTSTEEEKKDAKDSLESMKFFDDDYKPKDWNEAMREIVKNLRPVFNKLNQQEDEQQKQATKDHIQKINDEFDAAYDELAATNNLPKRGTEEGKTVDREITAVGAAFGITDYKKAYTAWSKMPKGTEISLSNGSKIKVGGLQTEAKPEVKKENPSKKVSRLMSNGNNSPTAEQKGKVEYFDIHNNSMDQLLEEDL